MNHGNSSDRRLDQFSRIFGVELLLHFYRKLRQSFAVEKPKVAISKGFPTALGFALLHLPPVGASVTLIVLNWRGYYIGKELNGRSGEDDIKLLALQFFSKFLELLVMASLSSIMFAIVRDQLLHAALPLGGLAAGFEFNKIQLLWSRSFASLCRTRFSSRRKKALLVSSLFTFTIIGVTIGPSSATASMPTLANWEAGGTHFWVNMSATNLWPSIVDQPAVRNTTMNATSYVDGSVSNHQILSSQLFNHWPIRPRPEGSDNPYLFLPQNAILSGGRSLFNLNMRRDRAKGPTTNLSPLYGWTQVTAPMAFLAGVLFELQGYWTAANGQRCNRGARAFCSSNSVHHSVTAYQPLVRVQCVSGEPQDLIDQNRPEEDIWWSAAHHTPKIREGSRPPFIDSTNNRTNPLIEWEKLPEKTFGWSSIAALVSIPGDPATQINDMTLTCRVEAWWVRAVAQLTQRYYFVDGIRPDGQMIQWNDEYLKTSKRISISKGWAESQKVFSKNGLSSSFQDYFDSIKSQDKMALSRAPYNAVEGVIAAIVVDGLARTNSFTSILGSLKGGFHGSEWKDELVSGGTPFYRYPSAGSAFDYNPGPNDDNVKLTLSTVANGYGYGRRTTAILSTVVLLVYVLIASFYIAFTLIVTRITSTSWDSIVELVALAVNSKSSPILQNTGAGISSFQTLKQPVRIVQDQGKLQLTFEEREEGDHVCVNEEYS